MLCLPGTPDSLRDSVNAEIGFFFCCLFVYYNNITTSYWPLWFSLHFSAYLYFIWVGVHTHAHIPYTAYRLCINYLSEFFSEKLCVRIKGLTSAILLEQRIAKAVSIDKHPKQDKH